MNPSQCQATFLLLITARAYRVGHYWNWLSLNVRQFHPKPIYSLDKIKLFEIDLQLPPWNTWNGVLKKFVINYWEVLSSENDSLIQVPNSSRNQQINSGSAKEATLLGLKRFADYQTQIRMCTSEGCGPKSHPWGFRGL